MEFEIISEKVFHLFDRCEEDRQYRLVAWSVDCTERAFDKVVHDSLVEDVAYASHDTTKVARQVYPIVE